MSSRGWRQPLTRASVPFVTSHKGKSPGATSFSAQSVKTGGSSSEGQTSLQRFWSFLMKLKNDGVKGQRVGLHVSSDRPLHKRDTIHANVDAYFFCKRQAFMFTFLLLMFYCIPFFFPFFTLNSMTLSPNLPCVRPSRLQWLLHCKSASSLAIDTICAGPGGQRSAPGLDPRRVEVTDAPRPL